MQEKKEKQGMILVMVVLITSAILAVGLGIFSSVFNQLRSASETKYSFNAFYAADQGMERTLYLDRVVGPLCPGVTVDNVGDIDCYTLTDFPVGNNACVTVRVSKDIKCDDITEEAGWTRVRSTGLYQCGSGELGVKRAFCLNYQASAAQSATFQEVGGVVQGEAEDFDQEATQGGHNWVERSLIAGASGDKYMEAAPDTGDNNAPPDYITDSPYMTYSINFTTTGTYYVWIGMNTPGDAGDTLHAGLDGVATPSAERIENIGANNNSWIWKNTKTGGSRATVTIDPAGVYDLYLWMQEDGNRIDQWLLTKNGGFTPPAY